MRRPSCVGTRPGPRYCDCPSKPKRYSRSCITLRNRRGRDCSDRLRVSVREPTARRFRDSLRQRGETSSRDLSFRSHDPVAFGSCDRSAHGPVGHSGSSRAGADYPAFTDHQVEYLCDHRPKHLDEMRDNRDRNGVTRHAEGSCMIRWRGQRMWLCTATLEESRATVSQEFRPWLGHRGIRHAAPRHPHADAAAKAASGKQSGRTQEFQRLIGRSLRAGVDRSALGERQITIDLRVIQADGGTALRRDTGGGSRMRAGELNQAAEGG